MCLDISVCLDDRHFARLQQEAQEHPPELATIRFDEIIRQAKEIAKEHVNAFYENRTHI